MATISDLLSDPELLESEWDLDPLVGGRGAAGVEEMLTQASARAGAFSERYSGKVSELDGAGLEAAMQELAEIEDLVGRAASFASLRFSTDTADPERGALLQRIQEGATEIETKLLFFDLEWAALEDAKADELLASPGLDLFRHYLHSMRRYRPHLLSEPEEKVLAEKAITSNASWARLFGELLGALRVTVEEHEETLDMALSRLQSTDREERRATAEAVTSALDPGLRTRGFIYNTLVFDKSVEDRLRKYPHWLAGRNLANEASDE